MSKLDLSVRAAMDTISRFALASVSPGGARGRLSILIYHRVLDEPDPLRPGDPDRHKFDWHLDLLKRTCNVLPLSEAVDRLNDGTLPERAVCITFDDGYADNVTNALPILKRYGFRAAFFIATGYIDGGCMWNDRIIEAIRQAHIPSLDLSSISLGVQGTASLKEKGDALKLVLSATKYRDTGLRDSTAREIEALCGAETPSDLMMSSSQVCQLAAAGMEIGAHTVNHPILSKVDTETALEEMSESKRFLQEVIGTSVDLFAYPNGKPGVDFRRDHVELARSLGFKGAVSTSWGVSRPGDDPLQLPRFTPWDQSWGKFMLRLMSNWRKHGNYVSAIQ